MSLRVALDASLISCTSTGDTTYWSGLLEGLQGIGSENRYLLFSPNRKPPDLVLGDRFEWHCTPASSRRKWNLVSFPRAAKRAKADLIHTQYSVSPLASLPCVSTIHDVSFFVGPEWFPAKDRFLLRKSIPATVRRVKRVITVSETSKREIEAWIPRARGKVRVTPNACPSWIQRIEREEAAHIVSHELGVEQPFLLTVGTRWPRKSMELAIRAGDLLTSDLPHKLVVTGKAGWGNAELGKRGVATGYVTNKLLSALYSAADLYIAPSKHEGFGIPLLEAFRCGCPVICSSGGALPEVAGDAALVQDNWEPEDWAASIDFLLRDRAKLAELTQLGFKRERAFSWTETAQATEAVYREVIP